MCTADLSMLCHCAALTVPQSVPHPQHPTAAMPLAFFCVSSTNVTVGLGKIQQPAEIQESTFCCFLLKKGWIFKEKKIKLQHD